MIFLNPAALFALAAASIPLILHLLNLRKMERVEFSTLQFLKQLNKSKIKKIKLKQWILLIIRTLIICFLVAAFARPTIKSTALSGYSSKAKTSAVIIIDDSPSMSIVTEEGSYLNQAKKEASELINNFEDGDEIIIIPSSKFNSSSQQIIKSISFARDRIEAILISDISINLGEQIHFALEFLEGTSNINKELYVFSDFQSTQFSEIKEIDADNFGEIKFFAIDMASKDAINLGITNFKSNNQIFELNKNLSFSSIINNSSARAINDISVSLFLNNVRHSQKSLSLKPGESKEISLEAVLTSTGINELFLELEEDDILADNYRYLSIHIPEKINILLLSDINSDAEFVNLALAGSDNTLSIDRKSFADFHSVNFSEYNVIVLLGGETLKNKNRIKELLPGNNNLIVFPGSQSSLAGFNELLSELNLPNSSKLNSAGSVSYYLVDKVMLDHPLFSGIFESNKDAQFDSPRIKKYFHLNKSQNSIITLADDSQFMGDYRRENSRVILFSSAPVLSSSDFPLKGIFAPLLNRIIYYLASNSGSSKSILAGEAISIGSKGSVGNQLKIVNPNKEEFFINRGDSKSLTFRFNETQAAGIYKFYSGNSLIDAASVNVPPKESSLSYYSEIDLLEYLRTLNFDGKFVFKRKNENLNSTVAELRLGIELWKFFLLAALLLAAAEMLIARVAKRDIMNDGQD
ncbi:MAG: BatA domain-containing protein [Bacteroidetes bacterium]|nr:BatA domain-containing protein [Bacteroidota bacterium]